MPFTTTPDPNNPQKLVEVMSPEGIDLWLGTRPAPGTMPAARELFPPMGKEQVPWELDLHWQKNLEPVLKSNSTFTEPTKLWWQAWVQKFARTVQATRQRADLTVREVTFLSGCRFPRNCSAPPTAAGLATGTQLTQPTVDTTVQPVTYRGHNVTAVRHEQRRHDQMAGATDLVELTPGDKLALRPSCRWILDCWLWHL